ncbi:hypothetical protein [Methylomonas rhizoryzae]|uniref:hypothetical protein n=1 Tax=Methylomonas rhizoryzae TaxID=2608981 RepID=UPI001231EBC5|nr:hypothetical protein [Methylomonas rhizoryzae]
MTVSSTWTFDEAMSEQNKYVAANPKRALDPSGPLFQWFALKNLEDYQKGFEQGDKHLLMVAISECAVHGLVMPDWVAMGYLRGFYAVSNARLKSWDDAFERPYPKGTNLKAVRKKRELSMAVLNSINSILQSNPKTPIDSALFEQVGQEFDIGKTLAADYYYYAKKIVESWYPRRSVNDP